MRHVCTQVCEWKYYNVTDICQSSAGISTIVATYILGFELFEPRREPVTRWLMTCSDLIALAGCKPEKKSKRTRLMKGEKEKE